MIKLFRFIIVLLDCLLLFLTNDINLILNFLDFSFCNHMLFLVKGGLFSAFIQILHQLLQLPHRRHHLLFDALVLVDRVLYFLEDLFQMLDFFDLLVDYAIYSIDLFGEVYLLFFVSLQLLLNFYIGLHLFFEIGTLPIIFF